ncbi:hypothetical protein Q1695_003695 [Nippostrongylus brasiliensis]|nr:hypothetical protein Q1695_003695 [Nippostrongylus brasiliensis]
MSDQQSTSTEAITSAMRDAERVITSVIRNLEMLMKDSRKHETVTPSLTQPSVLSRTTTARSNTSVNTAKPHTHRSRLRGMETSASTSRTSRSKYLDTAESNTDNCPTAMSYTSNDEFNRDVRRARSGTRDNSAFSDTSAGSSRISTAISPSREDRQSLEDVERKHEEQSMDTARGRSPTVRTNTNSRPMTPREAWAHVSVGSHAVIRPSETEGNQHEGKQSTTTTTETVVTRRTIRTISTSASTAETNEGREHSLDVLRKGKLFGASKTPPPESTRSSRGLEAEHTGIDGPKTAAALGTPCGRVGTADATSEEGNHPHTQEDTAILYGTSFGTAVIMRAKSAEHPVTPASTPSTFGIQSDAAETPARTAILDRPTTPLKAETTPMTAKLHDPTLKSAAETEVPNTAVLPQTPLMGSHSEETSNTAILHDLSVKSGVMQDSDAASAALPSRTPAKEETPRTAILHDTFSGKTVIMEAPDAVHIAAQSLTPPTREAQVATSPGTAVLHDSFSGMSIISEAPDSVDTALPSLTPVGEAQLRETPRTAVLHDSFSGKSIIAEASDEANTALLFHTPAREVQPADAPRTAILHDSFSGKSIIAEASDEANTALLFHTPAREVQPADAPRTAILHDSFAGKSVIVEASDAANTAILPLTPAMEAQLTVTPETAVLFDTSSGTPLLAGVRDSLDTALLSSLTPAKEAQLTETTRTGVLHDTLSGSTAVAETSDAANTAVLSLTPAREAQLTTSPGTAVLHDSFAGKTIIAEAQDSLNTALLSVTPAKEAQLTETPRTAVLHDSFAGKSIIAEASDEANTALLSHTPARDAQPLDAPRTAILHDSFSGKSVIVEASDEEHVPTPTLHPGLNLTTSPNTAILHDTSSGMSVVMNDPADEKPAAAEAPDSSVDATKRSNVWRVASSLRSPMQTAMQQPSSSGPVPSTRTAKNPTDFISPTSASGRRSLFGMDKDAWNLARNEYSETLASPPMRTARAYSKTPSGRDEGSPASPIPSTAKLPSSTDVFLETPEETSKPEKKSMKEIDEMLRERKASAGAQQTETEANQTVMRSSVSVQPIVFVQTRRPESPRSPYTSPIRTAIKDSMSPTPGVDTAIEESMSPTPGVFTAAEITATPRPASEPRSSDFNTALPLCSPTTGVVTARSIGELDEKMKLSESRNDIASTTTPHQRMTILRPVQSEGVSTIPKTASRTTRMTTTSDAPGGEMASAGSSLDVDELRRGLGQELPTGIEPTSSTAGSNAEDRKSLLKERLAKMKARQSSAESKERRPTPSDDRALRERHGRSKTPGSRTKSRRQSLFGASSDIEPEIPAASADNEYRGSRLLRKTRTPKSQKGASTPSEGVTTGRLPTSRRSRLPVLSRPSTPALQGSVPRSIRSGRTTSRLLKLRGRKSDVAEAAATDATTGVAPSSASREEKQPEQGQTSPRSLAPDSATTAPYCDDSEGKSLRGKGPSYARSKSRSRSKRTLPSRSQDSRPSYYGKARRMKRVNRRNLRKQRSSSQLRPASPAAAEVAENTQNTQATSAVGSDKHEEAVPVSSTKTAVPDINSAMANVLAERAQNLQTAPGTIVIHEQSNDGLFKLELHLACRMNTTGRLNMSGCTPIGLKAKKVVVDGKDIWADC